MNKEQDTTTVQHRCDTETHSTWCTQPMELHELLYGHSDLEYKLNSCYHS